MRKMILGMMTTLNGRLDDPGAWIDGISDDLLAENARLYEMFDTILVGEVTYHEMVGFWPGAEDNQTEPASIRKIAKKMNHLKKYVISATEEKTDLEWNNAEQVLLPGDEDILHFVQNLKSQEGKDIILTGGARLAQSLIRLSQVDEFYFNIYPVVSLGMRWFDQIDSEMNLKLLDTKTFENGVVRLHLAGSSTNKSAGGWDPNTESK